MYPEQLQKYIPPEFDVAKYDAVNIGLIGWIENIAVRLLAYMVCEQPLESVTKQQRELLIDVVQNNITAGVMTGGVTRTIIENISKDFQTLNTIVEDITYFELFYLMESLRTEEMEKLYSEVPLPHLPILQELDKKLNKPIKLNMNEDMNNAWLKLDMDCTDSEIMDAFSNWLTSYRASHKKSKSPRDKKLKTLTEATFRNWHDAKVIAYVDVMSWNYLNGNKLKNNIIGQVLYPDAKDMRDKTGLVSNKVKPFTKKVMSQVTLRRMLSIYAEGNRHKSN